MVGMWATETTVNHLRQRDRWKVEFFSNPHNIRKTTNTCPWTTVAQVVQERRESMDPQEFPKDELNYISLGNVETRTGDLVDFKPKSGKNIKSRSKKFEEGDILYGRLRPYLNKVLLANHQVSPGICSGEFYVLIPDRTLVLPVYLREVLASDRVQQLVGNQQTGTALPRLLLGDLMAIEIPLPPIDQQRVYENFITAVNSRKLHLREKIASLEADMRDALHVAFEEGVPPVMPKRGLPSGGVEPTANSPQRLPVVRSGLSNVSDQILLRTPSPL